MKKLLILALLFVTVGAQAKLKDQEIMKCIDGDRLAKSAFQDLQAAYEMRIVSARDFFDVMDRSPACPQLRKDIKKLQAKVVSRFSVPKSTPRAAEESSNSFSGVPSAPPSTAHSNFAPSPFSGDFPPPPMDEFSDDFNEFR